MVNIKNLSALVLLVLMMIVTTTSFAAAEQIITYTPTTTTVCEGITCTQTLYSGVQNVYEDDEWKDISKAKSLMDSGMYEIKYLETDEDYPMTVLDYNLTSITLDLDHWSFFNDAIDIRIWKPNQIIEDQYQLDVKDGKVQKSGLGSSYKDRFELVSHDKEVFNVFDLGDKKVTYSVSPGDIIEFGPNSTTIVLQVADSENLDDVTVREQAPTSNFDHLTEDDIGKDNNNDYVFFLTKFNISSLNSQMQIESANLSYYMFDNLLEGGDSFTVGAYKIYDSYAWDEAVVTWNTKPSASTNYNTSRLSYIDVNDSMTNNIWYDFDITDSLVYEVNSGFGQNYSVYFNTSDDSSSETNDAISFYSKRFATTSLRPKFQVTFSFLSPVVAITYPTTTTYPYVVNNFTWTLTNYTDMDTCEYSLNGAANESINCDTSPHIESITSVEGSNTIILSVEDINAQNHSDTIVFTQNLAHPEATITYPINGTNYSVVVNHFNWTLTNTSSLDQCQYSINGTANVTVPCGDGYKAITVGDGIYNILFTLNDTIGQMNSTQNYFVQDTTPPVINVTYPFETIRNETVGHTLYFNWTATDAISSLSSCWFDYNAINTTVDCDDQNTTFVTNTAGQRSIIFNVNDSVNNFATTTRTWNYKFLERSRTFNATSYETTTEGFTLNMSSDGTETVSAVFWYNNTEYSATKTGNNVEMEFASDVSHPWETIGNLSFYWTINHGAEKINSTIAYQDVQGIIMGACNSTITTPFLNFTFKDEGTDLFINASVEAYDWIYYTGDGSQNKSFDFVNITEQESYSICAAPNLTFFNNATITYEASGYPQRVYSQSTTLTNETTYTVLYLLSTDDGQYVTFQVQDVNSEKLNGVTLKIEKQFGGAWVLVETTLTDSAGTATFFLNPDDNHRITASKDGYTTYISIIRPTQSIYTIILEGGAVYQTYSTFEGIKFNTYPKTGTILSPNTTVVFGFNVTDTLGRMTACKLEIRNASFDILGSATGCNSAGGNITLALGTGDDYKLFGHYYINYGGGYLLIKSNDVWMNELVNISVNGAWVWDLMTSYNDYEGWGESHNRREYNRITFFFILLIFFLGLFTKYTGMEITDAGYTMMILTGVIIGFSITGLFTIQGVVANAWLSKYYIAIMTTMLTGGFLINYWRVRAAGSN